MDLLLLALALIVAGGLAALATARHPALCSWLGSMGAVSGCAVGLVPAIRWLDGTPSALLRVTWAVPAGESALGADALSAFFLVPLFGLGLLAALYGRAYWLAEGRHRSLGPPWLFFNVTLASVALVLVARSALLFLVAWESMAVASYLLVSFHHEDPQARRAGWIYLVAAHLGVACLILLFVWLGQRAGGLDFAAFAAMPRPSPGASFGLIALAALGFGTKAGWVPLHVWLPEAHAAAPSHMSALLSGVLLKIGLYGFLRVLTFMPSPPWLGSALISLGMLGGLFGVALALSQRDMKRVLAYSSIENVGLITLGLGIGFWGLQHGNPGWAALGLCGGLLHVWNHSIVKGLLFLSAGSVLHATGTRDAEQLGGLLRRMPKTGLGMVVGAVAISGMPPLNGFVGEWLMYAALARASLLLGGASGIAAQLAVGVLALIGGLAVLCFVRLVGVILLGQPRSAAAAEAHESPAFMTAPLILLGTATLVLASVPQLLLPALSQVATQLCGRAVAQQILQLSPALAKLGQLNLLIVAALALVAGVLGVLARRARSQSDQTWGCGYAAPSARMQYTAGAFSAFIQGVLPRGLRPTEKRNVQTAIFPAAASFGASTPDPFMDRLYEPWIVRMGERLARLRWMQQGVLQLYLLYIVVAVVAALTWTTLTRLGARP